MNSFWQSRILSRIEEPRALTIELMDQAYLAFVDQYKVPEAVWMREIFEIPILRNFGLIGDDPEAYEVE